MPKDVRYLSKRRKNQLMNCELHCYKDSLIQSIVRNVALSPVDEVGMTFDNISCRNLTLLKDQNRLTELLMESQSHVESTNGHDIELRSSFYEQRDIESCSSFDKDDTPTLTDIRDCMDETILRTDLQRLIIEDDISHNTANRLLSILNKHGHIELPSDVRVLLETPRNASVNFRGVGSGRYVHFGLSSALERSIKIYFKFLQTKEIKLNLNVDGLPLCKSSGSQFWPILASIEEIDVYTLPFIIGVYHGMCKPTDVNDFSN